MDNTLPLDNPEPEENQAGDFATRRIDPSELLAAAGQETPSGSEAQTELVTMPDDPAATKVVANVVEKPSPAPIAVEPRPAAPAQPSPPLPPATPKNDNRTQMTMIIAIAAVTLVCICACTVIAVSIVFMIPNF